MRVFLFLFLTGVAFAADVPKLEFEKTTFDFGKATEGDEVDGKFTFRNTGKGVLKIQTPETSCGCTVASVKTDTLQPGETGEITFKLDLTNARGKVGKSITVPSNDPQQPTVNLIIAGDVKALYELSSSLIFFGDIPPDVTAREVVQIRRLDGRKLTIDKAEVSREFLKASIEPPDTNDVAVGRLVIETKGTGKPEQFSDILSVTMANASRPAFHIPVGGEFVASIKVAPAVLTWKLPDPDPVRTMTITATLTNRPLTVDNFVTTFLDVMVKVDEVKTGQIYEVSVKLPEPVKETTNDWLTFDTNFPDHPTVAVPIRITVSPPSLPDAPLPK